jgi:hypothetical protein
MFTVIFDKIKIHAASFFPYLHLSDINNGPTIGNLPSIT